MPKYQVSIQTGAFAVVTVHAKDPEEAAEIATSEAPTICAQCSGWGSDDYELEVGDEWEVSLDPDGFTMVEEVDE